MNTNFKSVDEYIASHDLEAGEENDPEHLDQWRTKGTPVTLGNAEAKALTLKLTQ
jgi:hypothetical protein